MTASDHVDDPTSPPGPAAADHAISFGRFVLREKLGAGGSADVYRAETVAGAQPIGRGAHIEGRDHAICRQTAEIRQIALLPIRMRKPT